MAIYNLHFHLRKWYYLTASLITFINKALLLLLLSRFSRVQLCATPQMAAHQAPLSLGFSRQEHRSGLPLPSPMHENEKWKVKSLSRVQLFATAWTAAYQAPPSMGFSRQEYWSGLPLPSLNKALVCIFSWLKCKPQPLFFWSICQGPRTRVPNLRDLIHDDLRWSWSNNRNKVHSKCSALESSQNHPLHSGLWKNCLPWNCSLVPERLGMAALKHLSKSHWWVGEGEG